MLQAIVDITGRFWRESVFALWAGFIVAGLAVEYFFGRAQPAKRIWLNVRVSFIYAVIVFALGPFVFVATNAIASKIGLGLIDLSWLSNQSILAQAAFALLNLFILDFFIYWFHRSQHTIGWMWDIHLIHHSDEDINVTTTTLHSWLHFIVLAAWVALPMAVLFKLPEVSSAIIGTALAGWMFVTHLNVKLSLGRWSWLVVGPQLHRIHHSSLPQHFDKNFAGYFPIWDVIFGTYFEPAKDEYPPTGVPGSSVHSVTEATIYPFKKWLSVARAKITASE